MGFLRLAEIESRVSEACVFKIIFDRSVDVFLSLYIVSLGVGNNIRVFQVADITVDCLMAEIYFLFAFFSILSTTLRLCS